ncbi:pepsin/retropepsin-like aspartic protease family protein [Sutcliffiella halmapala]|uniref:aspartyl protease family protein n=1 Tax=Sutcliffiella halmapala TaxID=79882 RepID=UPI000995C442|nr:aspartyl protease family protein [Sutcliffiella halmapala]
MKFEMDDHLPLVAVQVEYNGEKKTFSNVLLDTGCSSTILDTDLCEEIGLMLDLENAITRKM